MWSRLLTLLPAGVLLSAPCVTPFSVLEDPVWALLPMLSGSRLTKRGLHPTQEKQSAQAVLRFIRSIPGGSLFGPDITIRKVVRPMLWDVTRPTLYASTEPRSTRPCRGLTAVRRSRRVHLRTVYTTTVIKQSHTERGSWLWPLPLGGGCETSQKRSPFVPPPAELDH